MAEELRMALVDVLRKAGVEQADFLRECHRTPISGHRRTRQRRPLRGWSKVVDYSSSGVAAVGMSEVRCRWRS